MRRTTHGLPPRLPDGSPETIGLSGFVAELLRQAIEDACGTERFTSDGGALEIHQQRARAWLRSDAWHPWVEDLGADPSVIRAELEQRYEWMR